MNSQKVLIQITNDSLIIANTGKHFDIEGVYSISHQSISRKTNKIRNIKTIEDIQRKSLSIYREDINLLTRDINSEKEISKDYQGRFIWELLQNADDATISKKSNRKKYIGEKGIGFKSVLEITNKPEIYSGKFNFYFSNEKNEQFLKVNLGEKLDYDLTKKLTEEGLIFTIPHKIREIPPYIKKLKDEGFSTIIVLPFKESSIKEKVKNIVNQIKPYQLLFLQNINEMMIKFKNFERKLFILKETEYNDRDDIHIENCIIEESINGNTKYHEFLKFSYDFNFTDKEKLYNTSIAIPLNNGIPLFKEEITKDNRLYIFFPTEEKLTVGFLLHATFDIEQNRKHIRKNEEEYKYVLDCIGKLTKYTVLYFKEIIKKEPKIANEILNIFIPEKEEISEIQEDLSNVIKNTLRNTEFIPTLKTDDLSEPEEVKSCTKEYIKTLIEIIDDDVNIKIINVDNISFLKIAKPELNYRKLEKLSSKRIDGSNATNLICNIQPTSKETSLELINIWLGLYNQHEDFRECLKNSSIWWTKNNEPISLNCEKLIFLDKPEFKNWLDYEVLDEEIKNTIEKDEETKKLWGNVNDELPILRKNKKEKIINEILKYLKNKNKNWWTKNGYECLNDLLTYRKFFKDEDLEDIFCIPVCNGSWEKGSKVYASESWGAFGEFAKFWESINDRYLVLDKERWGIEIRDEDFEDWKEFLKIIGVTWIPKLRERESFSLQKWDNYANSLIEYFKKEGTSTRNISKVENLDNFYLEHFPKCIENLDFKEQIEIIREIINTYKNTFKIQISPRIYTKSYLYWQLTEEKFLKFKENFLLNDRDKNFSLKECYLDEKGNFGKWKKILPILSFNWIEKIEDRAEFIKVFKKLNIKTDLPFYDINFWKELILNFEKKYNELDFQERNKLGRFIYKKLCNTLNKIRKEVDSSSYYYNNEKFSFIRNIKNSNLKFLSIDNKFFINDEIYFVDDYRFDNKEFLGKLTQEGIKIFILKLEDAKGCESLGIKPLSKIIQVEKVIPFGDKENFEKHKSKVFTAGLKVFFHHQNKKVYNLDNIQKLEITINKDFKLKIKINDYMDNISVNYYIDKENNTMWVKNETDIPDGIANFLNIDSNYSDNIEKLLYIDSKNKLIEYLKKKGIPEELFEDILIEENNEEENLSEKVNNKQNTNNKTLNHENNIQEKQTTNKSNESDIIPEHKEIDEQKVSKSTQNIDQTRNKKIFAQNDRGDKQSERIQGKKAEDIVKKEIEKFLVEKNLNSVWDLNPQAEDRTDIVLENKNKREKIYFEVKSSKNLNKINIHLSYNQIKKLTQFKDKFILVCVYGISKEDSINNNFEILWIENIYSRIYEILKNLEIKKIYDLEFKSALDSFKETNIWEIDKIDNIYNPKIRSTHSMEIGAYYKDLKKISTEKDKLLLSLFQQTS
ncbi:protein NO VEIN domain-containing protein [Persephonella sp.]